jgi:DNA (cytosine-5)-methyltransferase 1
VVNSCTCEIDTAFLRQSDRPSAAINTPAALRAVDLFSGCGGLTLGLQEAGRRNGVPVHLALAVDNEPQALTVLAKNLAPAATLVADLAVNLASEIDAEINSKEAELVAACGTVDLLVGGPPCQGNSNLNNRTRRTDPRNLLYGRMARAAAILAPKAVLIENVPSVRRAAQNIVLATQKQLISLGYRVAEHVIDSIIAGVPQRRRRHLLLAIHDRVDIEPHRLLRDFSAICPDHPERTVKWAIDDLRKAVLRNRPGALHRDAPGQLTTENRERIAFLFREGLYNLPNAERPKCHHGQHTYVSMYGRLRWDEPAQTVTSGFSSPGQGRYVHPSQRRTLTPHEAARLQTFPDWFDFSCVSSRGAWARMIGNAVPPLLNAHLAGPLVRALSSPVDAMAPAIAS